MVFFSYKLLLRKENSIFFHFKFGYFFYIHILYTFRSSFKGDQLIKKWPQASSPLKKLNYM